MTQLVMARTAELFSDPRRSPTFRSTPTSKCLEPSRLCEFSRSLGPSTRHDESRLSSAYGYSIGGRHFAADVEGDFGDADSGPT